MTVCPVDSVIWIITGVCNLNCVHCYAYRWRGVPELELEEKLRLVREFSECEIEYVNISGGEPLLHPHTPVVIDALRDYGIEVSIVSNGTVIDERRAAYLAKREVYAFVSLDGPREAHEAHRGKGTFDKVVRGVKMLREAGVGFSLVMAVSRLNWRHTAEFVEMAVKLGADRPILIPVMPAGRALENKVYIDAWRYSKAVIEAALKAKELGVKLQLWCSPFAHLVLPPSLREYVTISFCRDAPVIDIDPQGNLLLCDVIDVRLGNVRGRRLRDVIYEVERHPLVHEILTPSVQPPACSSCPYYALCRGGCFARSYLERGSLNSGDPLCPRVALLSRGKG